MPLSRAPALQSSGRFERARHALGIGPGLGGSAVTELQTFALCVLLLPRPCIVPPPSAIASPLPARRSVVATRCRRAEPLNSTHAYTRIQADPRCCRLFSRRSTLKREREHSKMEPLQLPKLTLNIGPILGPSTVGSQPRFLEPVEAPTFPFTTPSWYVTRSSLGAMQTALTDWRLFISGVCRTSRARSRCWMCSKTTNCSRRYVHASLCVSKRLLT